MTTSWRVSANDFFKQYNVWFNQGEFWEFDSSHYSIEDARAYVKKKTEHEKEEIIGEDT